MTVYKTNLYEQLLKDLKIITRYSSLDEYLFDLRPKASDLYVSLLSPRVEVDYTDQATQTAYMLRYLPGYWEQIYTALIEILTKSQWPKYSDTQGFMTHGLDPSLKELLDPVLKREEPIEDFNIALFCCGPAPEVIGIVRFFEKHEQIKNLYKNINIHLFDLKINSWKFARDTFVLNKTAMEKLSLLNFKFTEHEFDLTNPSLDFELDLAFDKQFFHICHFQNCLNEIFHKTSKKRLMSNIYSISKLLVNTGFFVFTDRNTTSSKEAANFITNSLDSNPSWQALPLISGNYSYDKLSPIPEAMRSLFWQSSDYKNDKERLIPTMSNKRFIQLIKKNRP